MGSTLRGRCWLTPRPASRGYSASALGRLGRVRCVLDGVLAIALPAFRRYDGREGLSARAAEGEGAHALLSDPQNNKWWDRIIGEEMLISISNFFPAHRVGSVTRGKFEMHTNSAVVAR